MSYRVIYCDHEIFYQKSKRRKNNWKIGVSLTIGILIAHTLSAGLMHMIMPTSGEPSWEQIQLNVVSEADKG